VRSARDDVDGGKEKEALKSIGVSQNASMEEIKEAFFQVILALLLALLTPQ